MNIAQVVKRAGEFSVVVMLLIIVMISDQIFTISVVKMSYTCKNYSKSFLLRRIEG